MKIVSGFLISAGIAFTSPALAADYQPPYNGSLVSTIAFISPALADDYQPPNNGHPDGTRVIDCHRGGERRENCSQI
ncbi:hypothetical protein [Tolypothrix sp. VBCCA 56010]|uniref:hypothetical protein n=1 Tax=Tolypothrix sp. VBCCA 56010 TaxID=3137731 RepID=UPI003D7C9BAA